MIQDKKLSSLPLNSYTDACASPHHFFDVAAKNSEKKNQDINVMPAEIVDYIHLTERQCRFKT